MLLKPSFIFFTQDDVEIEKPSNTNTPNRKIIKKKKFSYDSLIFFLNLYINTTLYTIINKTVNKYYCCYNNNFVILIIFIVWLLVEDILKVNFQL